MTYPVKWPAIVRFENSDEVDIIENQDSWLNYSANASITCQLIDSDGSMYRFSIDRTNDDTNINLIPTGEQLAIEVAVQYAREHMAAQEHCCVSKFSASSVGDVIAALVTLENESP